MDLAIFFSAMSALGAFVTAWAALRINKSTAGRAMVLLKLAGFEPVRGALNTTEEGKFKRLGNESPFMELAQVVVENPSRFPVTLRKVTLRVYGTSVKRRTVTPRVFKLSDMWSDSAAKDTYKRLGPYDHITYLMDFWSIVDSEFEKDPTLHKMTIRAEVEIAGHRKVFRSKAKWVFYSNTLSALKDQTQRRIEDVALSELVRKYSWDRDQLVHDLSGSYDLGYVAKTLASKLSLSSSQEEVDMAVRTALDSSADSSKERSTHHSPLVSLGIMRQLRRIRR